MLLLTNKNNVPELNLATEDRFLNDDLHFEDAVMLWRNNPSIIVGRYQNTIEEINYPMVKETGIPVVRRLSGGGAVYHDLGNINYTFFLRLDNRKDFSIPGLLNPVIEVLRKLGVPSEHSGRNDITVNGRKISGNAQYLSGDRLLHHGCILFSTDLEMVGDILKADPDKFSSKSVKSIRSRVANISEFLKTDLGVEEFMELLSMEMTEGGVNKELDYFKQQKEEIERIADSRYFQWSWNFGASPPYNIKNSLMLPVGKMEMRFFVQEGVIRNMKIYGDFLPTVNTEDFESAIIGKQFEESSLRIFLRDDPGIQSFISKLGMSTEQIIGLFFGQGQECETN